MADQLATGIQWVVDDSTGAVTGYRRKINGVDTAYELDAAAIQSSVSGERISNGTLVCDWGSTGTLATTGSTGTGFAFALDPTVTLNGKPAVKCTFPSDATAQTFSARWTPANPIRLRDLQTLHIPILYTGNNAAGGIGNPFEVWLVTDDFQNIRCLMNFAGGTGQPALGRPGQWHTISFKRGATAITGAIANLDPSPRTVIRVIVSQATTGAAAATNPVWIGEIRADVKRTPGRVSITMDGEYSSQYSIIHPLLAQYGLRATCFIENAQIDQSGRCTAAQLNEMYAYGHDMSHHTYAGSKTNGYVNATDWPTALTIGEDIRAQWADFRTRGWTRGIGYACWGYAYSFESGQTAARQALVEAGLRAGGVVAMRKSSPYYSTKYHLLPAARMPIDPLILSGGIQVTSTHTAQDVMDVIDEAEATGQWAIITLHRAVADGVTPGSLEMTASNMATWMAYLKARIDAGGIRCAPFGETYSALYEDKFTA